MKKIICFLFTVIIFCTACNQSRLQATNEITNAKETLVKKDFSNIAFASAKDTTCGMPLSAGIEDTLHVNGKVYGFCSAGCKNDFAAHLIK